MPDDHFSRVQEKANGRKFGEAPILGKVPRSPGSAVPRNDGKRIRKRRRKKTSRKRLAWTLFLSIGALAILTFFVMTRLRAKAADADVPEGSSRPPVVQE